MTETRSTSGNLPRNAAEAVEQVVIASRVVASLGEDLTLGHVSVRHADDERIFIKRKGVSGSELTTADVLEVRLADPDALRVKGMHLEAVIHTEIYRSRPDVGSVIHIHPPYATALSATRGKLEFLTHDSVLFKDGVGAYEGSAVLVTNQAMGQAVAESLGGRRATLLNNHGAVFAGEDIRWSVLAAVTLERALQLQVIASGLGELDPLPQEEVDAIYPLKYQDRFLSEYWDWWSRKYADGGTAGAAHSGEGPN